MEIPRGRRKCPGRRSEQTTAAALQTALHRRSGLLYLPAQTWSELNDYERFALRNDPRLPDFIRENALSLRSGQFGAMTAATKTKQRAPMAGDATSVDSQNAGVLTQEGENRWGYRFEPGELLNSKPLRLVEAPR